MLQPKYIVFYDLNKKYFLKHMFCDNKLQQKEA